MTNWIRANEHLPAHGMNILMKIHCKPDKWKSSFPSTHYIISGWCCRDNEDDEDQVEWFYITPEDYKKIDDKVWEITHWTLLPEKF